MNLARSNSRGISAIGFALVLPFALITIFAAFQFFLYMRAVATVQRAAAEAGQVLASSIPTSSSSSSGQILHSLPATSTKEFYASESGGDTEGDINASFAKHGTLYLRPDAGADPTDRTVLPFYFDRTRNPEDAAAADPGPMYLPMVRVWTCKDTYTDESNALSSCYTMSHSELSSDRNHAGFLTYQLPNMMDFDGDGREDIAIFDANASGDNWFVLTSSSGLLFRNAIRVDLGVANSSAGLTGGARWLPCPADYDGDGMTDFCIATVESGTAKARVRFSTMLYRYHQEFTLATGLSAQLLLPQPGNWGGTKQQFAAVLTETTSDTERLATYVWPEFTTTGNGVHSDTCYAISSDSGDRTMHTSSRTKPRYGRMWRPMFGDHDGDTKLDISFLEWPGGAITGHVAGASRGLQDFSSGPVDPSTALMSPWKLEEYFPVSGESGLYIVEKDNHRVTLIKRSTGGAVVGGSSESLMLIAGGTPSGVNYTDVTPAPHSRGYRTTQHSLVPISSSDDCSSLGAPYDSEGCCRDTMCPPGGGFSGDGGAPTSATLDTPMDVAVIGDNLFIADKGTYRVRMIYNDASGDTDDIVDGDAGERIYTVAGGEPYTNYADYHGVNPAATYCTDIHGVGPNGNFGRQSYHNGNGVACPTGHGWNWSCYEEEGGYDQEQYGVHPYCLLLSPVALEPAFGKSLSGRGLYIADEFGVIYLYHNHDGVFDPWNDTAERIFRVGGDIPANLFTDEFGSPTMTNGLDLTSTTMGAAVDLTNVANTRLLATINDFRPGHSTSNGGGGLLALAADGLAFTLASSPDSVELTGTHLSLDLDQSLVTGTAKTTRTAAVQNDPGSVEMLSPTSACAPVSSSPLTGPYLMTSWWADTTTPVYENGILMAVDNGETTDEREVAWLSSPFQHYWGMSAPEEPSGPYTFELTAGHPLATIPVAPTNDIECSTTGQAFFTETTRGRIMVMSTDLDGDGGTTADTETLPSLDRIYDGYATTTMSVIPEGSADTMGPYSGESFDMHEWWLPRFAAVSSVPPAGYPTPRFPTDEAAPFDVLSLETVGAAVPRGALTFTFAWTGGPNRVGQVGVSGVDYRLTPLIMGDLQPNNTQIKGISGYDSIDEGSCANMLMVEAGSNALDSNLEPVIDCTKTSGTTVSGYHGNNLDVGLRRAVPALWDGNWFPYSTASTSASDIVFIAWDGTFGRKPTVFDNDNITAGSARPLMLHIGQAMDVSGTGYNDFHCPGSHYLDAELDTLRPIVASALGVTLNDEERQYRCTETDAFFSGGLAGTYKHVSVILDARAEWATGSVQTSTANLTATTATRLSLGTVGDNDPDSAIGPVAQAAYRVLEQSLDVDRREENTQAHDAQVIFTDIGDGIVEIEVSYVYPFEGIIAGLLGTENATITGNVRRRAYNFDAN